MFIGHFAVAMGAKKVAPAPSLGTLFMAAQFADLLWPTLVLVGLEKVAVEPGATAVTPLAFISYPYSHSLLALGIWALLFGGTYHLLRRPPVVASVTLGLLVLSHWVLDAATHRPDLPLTLTGDQRIGLGLWNSVSATLITELILLAIGLLLYLRATEPRDRAGSIGLWSLVVFLLLVNLTNLVGPPPPSPVAVAWGAQALWILVGWGYWIDRHRKPRTLESPAR